MHSHHQQQQQKAVPEQQGALWCQVMYCQLRKRLLA
jgi:hypothetical protein